MQLDPLPNPNSQDDIYIMEKPDISWLKADIQAYMDTHSIAYSAGDSKSELLTKIEET